LRYKIPPALRADPLYQGGKAAPVGRNKRSALRRMFRYGCRVKGSPLATYMDIRVPREDTTAGMQEVEQRMEQLPTTAGMQEVEQRMEQLPRMSGAAKGGSGGIYGQCARRTKSPGRFAATPFLKGVRRCRRQPVGRNKCSALRRMFRYGCRVKGSPLDKGGTGGIARMRHRGKPAIAIPPALRADPLYQGGEAAGWPRTSMRRARAGPLYQGGKTAPVARMQRSEIRGSPSPIDP